MINKKKNLYMTLGSVLALGLFFAATAHAANPFCQREIEGISVAKDSVADIEAALKEMGMQDITCSQRSKAPCASRRKQMLVYATKANGFVHNVGDKSARVTLDVQGNVKGIMISYATEGPDSLLAYDENRSWDAWTYKDLIESRIAEFCNTDTPENAVKKCDYRSGVKIDIFPYNNSPRNHECNYTFEARFNNGGNPNFVVHVINESLQIHKK